MKPLVSVLIPCHNAAPWLAATLDSALLQTWQRIEIIVVDDGSIDDSLAIARRYESRGVRVVRQSRGGASSARNHAFRISGGDLVQFLDADDLISPDKIAAQVGFLSGADARSMATCRWARFTADPGEADFSEEGSFRDFLPIDYLIAHTSGAATMHPAAWLVPRDVAQLAGPWDETLSLNDDGEYFSRAVLAASRVCFCPAGASFYRSNLPDSLSRQRSRHALESLYRSVSLVAGHLLKSEDSPRVRRALADYWQRLRYELYPSATDLSQRAASEVRRLGGSSLTPAMGRRSKWVSSVFGWRVALRMREWLR